MTNTPIILSLNDRNNTNETPAQFRTLPLGLTWAHITLIGIILLALGLRLVNADVFADGNTYYTAAVKNMLKSPSNFFFATADAGNVTVDKPPVALWIQAIFGGLFGVNGFTVTLPSIIAGTLSVVVLYHLVKKGSGTSAGLIAAFTLAVTPISIATDRTNNLDSLLIFTLLLATWGFIRATETGKIKYLLIGATLIGVGFNIKMLQAYLIIPALYAFYFLGSNTKWLQKVVQLVIATAILLAVSFSWATVVQLIPEDQRPYIGGSETNSAFELAIGYNGLQRLLGQDFSVGSTDGSQPQPLASSADTTTPTGNFNPTQAVNGVMFANEVGNPGIMRLFTQPLSNELSWLLPFGILTIGILIISTKIRLPLRREHQLVMLWGGWLMTCVVFFSISEFFHAYYLATPAPALAALVGIGMASLWKMSRSHHILAIGLLIGIGGISLILQIITANEYGVPMGTVLVIIGGLVLWGIGWLVMNLRTHKTALSLGAFSVLMTALFVIPASWGLATATSDQHSMMLPSAYNGTVTQGDSFRMTSGLPTGVEFPDDELANTSTTDYSSTTTPSDTTTTSEDTTNTIPLIAYLQANAGDEQYIIAVQSSQGGAQIVLETDLGVLFLGGFSGSDPIHDAESIAKLVSEGNLRYILSGGDMGIMMGGGSDTITSWVTEYCEVVEGVDLTTGGGMMGGRGNPAQGMDNLPMPPQGMTNMPTPPQGMTMQLPAGVNVQELFQQSLYDCSGYNGE